MAKKVLIIDDDEVFQKTLGGKLRDLEYEVVSATDGEEGVKKANEEKPDIILLDIKMPKMDGMEVLQKLHDRDAFPPTPVLMTSNMSGIDNISEGIRMGVKGYIIKSNETLGTIIKEVEKIINPDKIVPGEIIPVE